MRRVRVQGGLDSMLPLGTEVFAMTWPNVLTDVREGGQKNPPLNKASYYHLIKAVSFCSEKGKHSSFYSQTYSQKITITLTSRALCPLALRKNSGGRIQNCRKTREKKPLFISCLKTVSGHSFSYGGCAWRHTRAHQTDYGCDGPAWTLFILLPVSSLFDNFTWGKVSRPRQNNPSHTHTEGNKGTARKVSPSSISGPFWKASALSRMKGFTGAIHLDDLLWSTHNQPYLSYMSRSLSQGRAPTAGGGGGGGGSNKGGEKRKKERRKEREKSQNPQWRSGLILKR